MCAGCGVLRVCRSFNLIPQRATHSKSRLSPEGGNTLFQLFLIHRTILLLNLWLVGKPRELNHFCLGVNSCYSSRFPQYNPTGRVVGAYIERYRRAHGGGRGSAQTGLVITTGKPGVQPRRTVPVPGSNPTRNPPGFPHGLSPKWAQTVKN